MIGRCCMACLVDKPEGSKVWNVGEIERYVFEKVEIVEEEGRGQHCEDTAEEPKSD